MDPQEIANEGNSSIGVDYCANVCHARCCKSGGIWFEERYIDLITQGQPELVYRIHRGIAHVRTDLGGCPSLDEDNRCMVYDEEGRPYPCKNYPLQFKVSSESPKGRYLKVWKDCTAVKAGLLDDYIARIEAEDVEIL